MKKMNMKIIAAVSLSFLLGCSSASKKSTEPQFTLRPMQEVTLPNGLKVIYIHDKSLPRVSFQLLVQGGSADDPKGAEGLSALTVSLLESGSAKKNALQIADDFAQLGSSFNEMAANDYVIVSTSGLSETKSQLLQLFADVSLNPAFAKTEVERKRSQVLAQLAQRPDDPTGYASLLFDEELFGTHPYAAPVSGYIPSVKKISQDQIRKHYQASFRPQNSMLAVVGQFDDAFKAEVEKTFSAWQKSDSKVPASLPAAASNKVEFKLFTKAGLAQSQIRMGQIAIGRADPDFLKLRLGNIVLGGAFASRLNQKVRDDLGLTYSIHSGIDARKGTGSFEINTFARNEKSGEAIKSTLEVVREFSEKGITQKELDASKALLIGQFPAAVETADRLAMNLMMLRVYGVPDTYLTNFFENVKAITLEEVNAAIKKHIHPSKFTVVVFADEKAVAKPLSEVGKFVIEKAP